MTRLAQLLLTQFRSLHHTRAHHGPRWRGLATHRDAFPSLVAQQLDGAGRQGQRGGQYVGPFPMGIAPGAGSEASVKSWKQLSASGKVVRATARTSNFAVIALGASLTALLVYALSSELFSRNSPTVLYNVAIGKIEACEELAKHLRAPYKFRTNPPSSQLPRHRNRSVSSLNATDAQGREHLLLTFYIQGASEDASDLNASDESYWSRTVDWTSRTTAQLSTTSFHEAQEWVKENFLCFVASSQRILAVLVGVAIPSTPAPAPPPPKEHKPVEPNASNGWGFAGMFSGIRTTRPSDVAHKDLEPRYDHTHGEVHADLIRDDSGNFVFRYLFVDLPNSRVRNPKRIYVERASDVRDAEPVLLWE
ncbi:hypothetical protein AURDEDRAFT_155622 [Auricularia subglabra TFB-10046 SS5]|nr:hypothetical protein AURDEDRAFT_155622 [Auricularia subglabra TFB-10046 SS5]